MVTREPHRSVVGAFEPVIFPEFGKTQVRAKIDTGAYTGALHCSRIEEKTVEGGKILTFKPLDHTETIVKDDYIVKHVKSSNGDRQERYFVTTPISLKGKQYIILLSLTDRSDMRWPVLIGRRFLRQHNIVVDPGIVNKYGEQVRQK